MGDPFVTNQTIKLEDVLFSEALGEQRKAALDRKDWSVPIDRDEFVRLKSDPYDQSETGKGAFQIWVVANKSSPLDIIASCHTIRKEVFIADATGFRMATGYGIAAVYTNPQHRRLGMAAYLLKCVKEELDKSSECSALYSDIGPRYYRELGWSVFPSAQVTINIVANDIRPLHTGRTIPLGMGELPVLCAKDVEALKRHFETLARDGKTHVAFSPSYAQIASQLGWEDLTAELLLQKHISTRGAVTVEGKSWIYWEHDFRKERLQILRIVTSAGDEPQQQVSDIAALLEAALLEATQWGIRHVIMWNPDELLTLGMKAVGNDHESVVSVIFDERLEKAIPQLRWKSGQDATDTVWEENFAYAYC
jgi:GNAT superfamily N-acetyltransferase